MSRSDPRSRMFIVFSDDLVHCVAEDPAEAMRLAIEEFAVQVAQSVEPWSPEAVAEVLSSLRIVEVIGMNVSLEVLRERFGRAFNLNLSTDIPTPRRAA